MKTTIPTLSRLLIPVKNIELFRITLPLVEALSSAVGGTFEKIDLLHVVGGSFLSTHLSNIDFRAGHVLSSEVMRRLREQHYEDTVNPMLEQVQELLRKSGSLLKARVLVENGDPVKKISAICESGKYSSMIFARQKGVEGGLFTGSVINGILQRHFVATIYLVGEEGFAVGDSPVKSVVIGVDGSPASDRAVREAAILLGRSGEAVTRISLAYVMDQACLVDEESMTCQEASQAGERYLQAAKEALVNLGGDASCISKNLLFGKPAEALATHARSIDATMLYIGRRDRSNISQVLLGSVCGDIMQRYRDKTVVLVC